jgi:hypothetical protein
MEIYHRHVGTHADAYSIDFEDDPVELSWKNYKHIATDPNATLETVYERWNAGSGRESQQFLSLQYCPECDVVFDDNMSPTETHSNSPKVTVDSRSDDAKQHADQTGHTIMNGPRSLSVGDVVETDTGTLYVVKPVGFAEASW